MQEEIARDAPEKPRLYGYHQGQENLHYCGHHQGISLFHTQHGRAEAEYKVEGKAIYIIFDTRLL